MPTYNFSNYRIHSDFRTNAYIHDSNYHLHEDSFNARPHIFSTLVCNINLCQLGSTLNNSCLDYLRKYSFATTAAQLVRGLKNEPHCTH